MTLENPFFLKELRSAGRRAFMAVGLPLLLQGCLLTLVFLIAERRLFVMENEQPGVRLVLTTLGLGLTEGLVCALAGWILGARVFMEEHRQGTLEAVRLISRSPWRWLPQKLLFPAYGLLLVWLSALPFHAALTLRGHLLPAQLWPGHLLAGCMGVLTFGVTLLAPPEGLRATSREEKPSPLESMRRSGHLGLAYWIAGILAMLGFNWIRSIVQPGFAPFQDLAFYGDRLRADHGLAVLMGAYAAAAFGGAAATANPTSPAAAFLGRFGRPLAFAAAYYLFVGYTWSGLGPPFRWLAVAAPPLVLGVAQLLGQRRKRRRWEDPRSAVEIGWLARRFDNPVLVRDLRVLLRRASLRRLLLLQVTGLLLGSLALSGFALTPLFPIPLGLGGTVTFRDFVRVWAGVFYFIGCWAFVPVLLTFGARGLQLWQTEARANTLTQLLTSPLPTETLLRGRWAASCLVGIAQMTPVLAGTAVCIFILFEGYGFEWYLVLGAAFGSAGLAMSLGYAGTPQKSARRAFELWSPMSLSVAVMIAEGIGAGFAVSRPEWFGSAGGGPEYLLGYAALVTVLNVGAAYGLYYYALAWLNGLRARELE
ncbi:MAG: hypothetical protein ACK47B_26490 [Armatimonadota bacterium]